MPLKGLYTPFANPLPYPLARVLLWHRYTDNLGYVV
jgi:hypothetical protein